MSSWTASTPATPQTVLLVSAPCTCKRPRSPRQAAAPRDEGSRRSGSRHGRRPTSGWQKPRGSGRARTSDRTSAGPGESPRRAHDVFSRPHNAHNEPVAKAHIEDHVDDAARCRRSARLASGLAKHCAARENRRQPYSHRRIRHVPHRSPSRDHKYSRSHRVAWPTAIHWMLQPTVTHQLHWRPRADNAQSIGRYLGFLQYPVILIDLSHTRAQKVPAMGRATQ